MAFKLFRVNVVFRVLLLMVGLGLLVYCLAQGLYLRSIYVGIGVIIVVVEFIWYVEKTTRDFTSFLLTISQNDFTTTYSKTGRGRSFRNLYRAFNQITSKFRAISAEKEAQFLFLKLLVEHIRVGIISFDSDEQIHLINESMKKYLTHPYASNLEGLTKENGNFVDAIRQIKVGDNLLLKTVVNGRIIPLTLHAAEFSLQNKYYKLISAQDIRSELDANELEAWQKLIRVLTHEIMNSVSPITSLSATFHQMMLDRNSIQKTLTPKESKDLELGLEAIRSRSAGLQNFTDAYRSLTRVPQPQFKDTPASVIIDHLQSLFDSSSSGPHTQLTFILQNPHHSLNVDAALLEQVLINLIKNAIDATQGIDKPQITVSFSQLDSGIHSIRVADNGHGIPPEILDKIFIPFFTTKPGGSGIGLALSKQIIQLHRGTVTIESTVGQGTTVEIRL